MSAITVEYETNWDIKIRFERSEIEKIVVCLQKDREATCYRAVYLDRFALKEGRKRDYCFAMEIANGNPKHEEIVSAFKKAYLKVMEEEIELKKLELKKLEDISDKLK